jgi:hypothetical protein
MHFKRIFLFLAVLFCPVAVFAYTVGNVELKPYATLAEAYDDNITYSEHNRISDFITQSLLGLQANYAGKTTTFSLLGALRYDTFAEHRAFDNLSEDFSLNVKKELSQHDSISFADTFIHAQEPRSFEDAFGRTNGRYSYYQNTANTAYTHELSQNLSFDLHDTYGSIVYSRNDIADSYLDKVGSAWQYAYNPETIALFSYDYSLRYFDPGPSMSMHTVMAGARRYLTNQLYVEGDAGVDSFITYAKHSYTKPLFTVALNDTVNGTTVAGLNFTREYSPNGYYEDVLDSWRISGNLQHQLSARLMGNLNFFWGEGKYITTNVKDELTGARAALAYDLFSNTQLLTEYSYSLARSTVISHEYRRNSVRLGAKVVF